jgi:hypothetical protein
MSLVTTLVSGVYHLLHMGHVHNAIRIKFSERECLLTFDLNLRCTWYVVDSDCGLKVVTHLVLLGGMIDLEKVDSIFLRNVSIHLQDYPSSWRYSPG